MTPPDAVRRTRRRAATCLAAALLALLAAAGGPAGFPTLLLAPVALRSGLALVRPDPGDPPWSVAAGRVGLALGAAALTTYAVGVVLALR